MALGDFLDAATQACYLARRDPSDTYDIARSKEQCNSVAMALCDTGDPWTFLDREYSIDVDSTGDLVTHSVIETEVSTTPHNIRKVLQIVNDTTGRDPLQQLPWAALESLANATQETGEVTGEPRYWCYIDNKFRIYPKPDKTYTLGILCRLAHGELTSDTDVFLVPKTWVRRVIAYGAAEVLLRQGGGGEAANEADRIRAQYNRDVELLRENYGSAEEDFVLIEPTAFDDIDYRLSDDGFGY